MLLTVCGPVAEWLRTGLQLPLSRFKSWLALQSNYRGYNVLKVILWILALLIVVPAVLSFLGLM